MYQVSEENELFNEGVQQTTFWNKYYSWQSINSGWGDNACRKYGFNSLMLSMMAKLIYDSRYKNWITKILCNKRIPHTTLKETEWRNQYQWF